MGEWNGYWWTCECGDSHDYRCAQCYNCKACRPDHYGYHRHAVFFFPTLLNKPQNPKTSTSQEKSKTTSVQVPDMTKLTGYVEKLKTCLLALQKNTKTSNSKIKKLTADVIERIQSPLQQLSTENQLTNSTELLDNYCRKMKGENITIAQDAINETVEAATTEGALLGNSTVNNLINCLTASRNLMAAGLVDIPLTTNSDKADSKDGKNTSKKAETEKKGNIREEVKDHWEKGSWLDLQTDIKELAADTSNSRNKDLGNALSGFVTTREKTIKLLDDLIEKDAENEEDTEYEEI